MKIAMVGQKGIPATYGGIERHVEEIATRLVERGHQVTVYSRLYYSRHRGPYRGIENKRLPSLRTKHFDAITHSALATLHASLCRYDIVHFHALGPSIFSFLPRLVGKRSVVTVHGLDWQRGKWGRFASAFLKFCEVPSVRFPSGTIVVSRTLAKYFHEKHKAQTFVIPNGTNAGTYRPPSRIKRWGLDKHPYILWVGRLVPEKGCHHLIEAFRKTRTDMRLVMAGGSSFSDDYIQSLERLRDGDERIQMIGYVYGEVLDELWSNAYLVVQPSILEGLSIALIEALSYGRCVLVSDIPENIEVVEDRAISFRCSDVEDLRAKLQMCVDHPDMVAATAERCKALAEERFSWPHLVEATEEFYERVLRGERPCEVWGCEPMPGEELGPGGEPHA
ncbi:MAG: glycosyltransferase family 4 protein [Candidatus Eisenbacteria bacterium]|nr:glycosyltransferase family 4 protein [Candidatus Eisenbacteria bacterium]